MISYKDAKLILLEAGQSRKCRVEMVILQDSVGRVCAVDMQAPIDIQPFDNSAMDGFALRLDGLTEDGGALLKAGTISAGDPVPEEKMKAGQCIAIMTGAPVPPETEAVVPIELVKIQGDEVVFSARPEMGANIRRAGEDFKKGMAVLKVGQTIFPQHIMPLAALGISEVKVFKVPKVACLATGLELVDDLSQELASGQIYNSNAPYMKAALSAMGVEVKSCGTVADDPDAFQQKLACIMKNDVDIAISTGAVSAGKFDFVRKGLEEAGAEILFHKVKIKPGKPNLFARLPNGTLYFGLPGNPVATAAGLRFFVQPCLRAMMGMEEERPVQAKVMTSFKKRKGLQMFLKAYAESWEDGILTVDLLDGQASFMVKPFLSMNCWAVAPEDSEEIRAGDILSLHSLSPHGGFL